MHRGRVVAVAACLVVAGATPAWAAPAAGPSSTRVTLSTVQSAYGQFVSATAAVTTDPGPAQGDIVFTVDGSTIDANLGGGGTATAVLPRLGVGDHSVSATFVPQFPASQQGSTSPTQDWVVVPVRTRLQVRVIGRGLRIPTSVQVKAAGEYGTLPTGRVRLELRRTRSGETVRTGRRLSASGVAEVDLGRLHAGRYRLVTTFLGDSQHLLERQFTRFRVQQR